MKKVILIFSYAYSGSTMLDCMLGNSDNGFSLGEVYALYRPHMPHHFQLDCSCGDVNCPIWSKLKKSHESKIYSMIFEKLNVDYIVDSSKHLCWMVDAIKWAKNNRYVVKKVLLWKHPINFAYSCWKRGDDLIQALQGWLLYYKRTLEIDNDFELVNYEKLVKNPSYNLKQLCNSLGIDYFPGKEYFWTKKHHILFGNAGLVRQIRCGSSLIRMKEDYNPQFIEIKDNVIDFLRSSSTYQYLNKAFQGDSDITYSKTRLLFGKPYWYYGFKKELFLKKYKILLLRIIHGI